MGIHADKIAAQRMLAKLADSAIVAQGARDVFFFFFFFAILTHVLAQLLHKTFQWHLECIFKAHIHDLQHTTTNQEKAEDKERTNVPHEGVRLGQKKLHLAQRSDKLRN